MKNISTSFLALVLVLTAVFLYIPPFQQAHATNTKWYAGQQCRASVPTQHNDIDHAGGATARNTSSSSRSVICNIVKDELNVLVAKVHVQDRNYSTDFHCQYWFRESAGSFYYESRYSEGSSESMQELFWGPMLTISIYAASYIWCSIPGVYSGKHSQLWKYGVTESQ